MAHATKQVQPAAGGSSRHAALVTVATLGLFACSEQTSPPPLPAAPAVNAAPQPPGDPEDAETYAIGFEAGREDGYADGHREGFDEGYDQGLEEGLSEGRSIALECVRKQSANAAEAADLCE